MSETGDRAPNPSSAAAPSSSAPGDLGRLYEVQQIDLKLDSLKERENDVSDALRTARGEQERLNNELEDTEITLEGVDKQARLLDLEVATTREQIARNKSEQDKNATNAKAQTQYENVIQQLLERVGEYEESLAPIRERQQALSERAQGLRGEHRALRPELGRLEDEDEQRVAALRAGGQADRESRAALAATIDGRLLREYDQIRSSPARRGLGIVPFGGGRCKGCNVQLPTNVQQRAAQGKLPAVKCPSCGRFLIKL